MGLRGFHLLFIALSVVLTAFVATWAASQYWAAAGMAYMATAAVAAAAGTGLAVYGARFQRKTRRL